ncbi:hypothetical protein RB653_007175 [Dictyostelium firmibasis]|uniref:Integrator complex subunit 14 n=1 Tax=Dictyostelium firmibasis TaxID=79012 RepID=A0AAN7YUF1_9MYCE
MPTVLLLDVSISMAHSIFRINNIDKNNNEEEIKTYFDVLKSTIGYFLSTLTSKFTSYMANPITLLTYSSDVNIVIPFTKGFQEFLNEFENVDIRLSDRTDLLNALNQVSELIQATYGNSTSTSTEIFIFTDQCTAFDQCGESTFSKIKKFQFPFIHQFHFISICIKDNHLNHSNNHLIYLNDLSNINNNSNSNNNNNNNNQLNNNEKDNNQIRVNNNFRGTIDIVKLNGQIKNNSNNIMQLNIELTNIISRIVHNNYNLYKCVLVFGRLSSPMTVYPNPMTLLHFLNNGGIPKSIFMNGTTVNDKDNNNQLSMSILSIIGYLPNKSLNNIPSLSRHVLIPLISDSKPSTLPPLGPVLQSCLRNEKKTAIVHIQNNWYGMINSTYENDVPVLALSLFEPNVDLPFLGEDLTCLELGNLNDLQQQQQLLLQQQQLQQQQQGIPQKIQMLPPQLPFPPVQSQFTMSYNTVAEPNIIPYIKMDSIHSDFTKISRLFKSLPQKLESIFSECEKIRLLALMYQPSLLKALLTLVNEEIRTNKIPDEKTYYYLAELLLFIENPVEPITANNLAYSINSKNPPQQPQQLQQQQQHQHQPQHQQHQPQHQQQHQQQHQHQPQQQQHQQQHQPQQQHQQPQQQQQIQQHQQIQHHQQHQQQQYQPQQYEQQQQQNQYSQYQQYQQNDQHYQQQQQQYQSSNNSYQNRDHLPHSSSHHHSGGSSSNNRGRKEKK